MKSTNIQNHIDTELPKCRKSRTDMLDPKRAQPKTEIDEPTRPKERTDIELPKCKKSMTDALDTEPLRVRPKTLTAEPTRA